MLFNSFEFLIFFPTVVVLYFLISYKWRWMLLLIASYCFYMFWKVEYIILIIASTLVDYFAANRISKISEKNKKLKYLYLSLFVNLGLLFSFKYLNFFSESIHLGFSQFDISLELPTLQVLLPVGISFYTFQTLSYTIDVYNEKIKPERHLGIFAVYVAFFPQLVAGPIERAGRLIPQLRQKFDFDYERVKYGLMLMAWGFFKKLVIADRLSDFVNPVYSNPGGYDGLTSLIATYFFSFQIYCDFSGYSDIAIGAALIMGYKLMMNFNRPYFAQSIRDFWKRWHISLSTWFRDYLYVPLGGNRVVKWRFYYNLIIVFFISGLWHGANWTFAFWGILHGGYLIFSLLTSNLRNAFNHYSGLNKLPKLHKVLKIFITFHLVVFAWIFFRANSMGDAIEIISKISQINLESIEYFKANFRANISFSSFDAVISILAITALEFVGLLQENNVNIGKKISYSPIWVRWSIYAVFVLNIILFGKISTQKEFVYFQF